MIVCTKERIGLNKNNRAIQTLSDKQGRHDLEKRQQISLLHRSIAWQTCQTKHLPPIVHQGKSKHGSQADSEQSIKGST